MNMFWKVDEEVDVLIVSTVEPFVDLDHDVVPWRSGKIFNYLVENNLRVKVVTSTFNHYTKKFRESHKNGNFLLLRSIGYKNNVSFYRFLNYIIHVPQIVWFICIFRPKLVLITLPPVIHLVVFPFVKIFNHKIKFWIDVRDLWPEVFVELASRFSSLKVAKLFFYFSFKLRSFSLKKFDYCSTISPIFVDILAQGNARLGKKIRWFPHPKPVIFELDQSPLIRSDRVKFVYIGSLSERTNIVSFIRNVAGFVGHDNCEFVIGGRGFLENSVIDLSMEGINITFLGWVPGSKVSDIIQQADFGLIPYPPTLDFDSSFPNKFLEYCALGMRVLSNPLSIYAHNDFPLELRPYTLDQDFLSVFRTPLTTSERLSRQKAFEETLSVNKMQLFVDYVLEDLKANDALSF